MTTALFAELPTKERIVRIAATLFAEQGYHAVGVNEICKAAGLSRGALYHHISGKEDILFEICSNYMAQLGDLAKKTIKEESDPQEQLRLLGRDLIRIIARHRAELKVCFREIQSLTGERRSKVLDLHAVYERVWADVLKAGAESGRFKPFSKLRLKGLLGMYYYSYIWIPSDKPEVISETIDTFHEIVVESVLVQT